MNTMHGVADTAAESLLRCDGCPYASPVTRHAAGLRAHTMHEHSRYAYHHELVPRTSGEVNATSDPLHGPPIELEGRPRPRHVVVLRRGRGGRAFLDHLL